MEALEDPTTKNVEKFTINAAKLLTRADEGQLLILTYAKIIDDYKRELQKLIDLSNGLIFNDTILIVDDSEM